jgi:hypothetical protein
MPKSPPRRNAAEAKNRRFLKGNYPEKQRSVAGTTRLVGIGRQPANHGPAADGLKMQKPAQPPKGVERARDPFQYIRETTVSKL